MEIVMRSKRVISVVTALGLIVAVQLTTPTSEDATRVQLINSDLVWLTVSSFNQIDEQVQECTQNANCDK
jgi:hypothetical protein